MCLALFRGFLEVTFGQLSRCLEVSPPFSMENGPGLGVAEAGWDESGLFLSCT